MNKEERTRLMVEIARMTYEQNFSQQKIADRLNISRTYVGKLLDRACKEGIVRITITDPFEDRDTLEHQMKELFGLEHAVLVPDDDDSPRLGRSAGKAAADYMDGILKDGDTVAVAWGGTLLNFAAGVHERKDLKDITVTQLSGGVSEMSRNVYASEIPIRISKRLNGKACLLPAPAVVENARVKDMLMEDKSVAETIAAAEQADIAVFTVGVLDERSAFARAGYFSDEELQSLAKRGIVGDVCAHLIDGKGQICGSEYEKRIIAVPMDRIQSIPVRIGIAYGEYKLQGVYAALRAGYFTAFVTNTAMAGRLLRRKHLEEKGK